MAKKIKTSIPVVEKKEEVILEEKNSFYFGKQNFKWMLIGLACIALGFILMMGSDANTRPDGTFDSNYFNENIFSVVRVRIAPLLIIIGFVIQVFAILKRK